jgi:hypothetical protein
VESSKKEMSRSSLSVTDSKTIVLTNSPGPWRTAADKKKELERVLGQHQNHKLVNAQHKVRSSEEEQEGRNKKPRLEEGGMDASGPSEAKASQPGGGAVSSNASAKSEGKKDVKKKGVSTSSSESSNGVVEPSVKDAESAQGEGVKIQSPSSGTAGVNTGVSSGKPSPTTTTTAAAATTGSASSSVTKKDDGKAEKSASAETKRPKPSPKPVDIWKMRGPANGIVALNAQKNAKRRDKGKPKNSLVGFNLDCAHVITSQFIAKATKRKEEGASAGGVGGTDIVPPLGILVRGATAGSRSGSSTPTILGATVDMATQQILPVGRLSSELQAPPISTNAGPIISQPLQENMVIAKGVEVKRTNSIGAEGVGVHVTLSSQSSGGLTAAHHLTGSAGTNGTNLQEIFNTKRKLSENSERGLKQALAG